MTDVGRDLMFCVIFAHKADRIPVIFGETDIFLTGKFPGQFFVPIMRLDQIAFFIYVWQL